LDARRKENWNETRTQFERNQDYLHQIELKKKIAKERNKIQLEIILKGKVQDTASPKQK
jgi:isopentenyl diphosphate isomerase/L-lactate dehydrogenase-like FMN-dependent dehydrogenase